MANVEYMVYDANVTPPQARVVEAGDRVSVHASSYTFIQDTPNALWSIQHNLGTKELAIDTFLSTGERIFATADWASATVNHIDIIFANPKAGTAIVRAI
ncbi:MAG: hypothetical protein LBS60_09025 [Deltaproteobacteria bacterium]|jgi:hypothetical protein|nr:hypothetical protein [Deltaproteobacteria bacterium]